MDSNLLVILQSGLILYLYIHTNLTAKIHIVDIYVLVNLYRILLISTLVFYRWCVPSRRGQCSRNCIYICKLLLPVLYMFYMSMYRVSMCAESICQLCLFNAF